MMSVKKISVAAVLLLLWLWAVWPKKKEGASSFRLFESDRHLGCFDATVEVGEAKAIQAKWKAIQSARNAVQDSKKVANNPTFEKDIRELARAVEKYLDESYRVSAVSDFEQEYYSHLQQARAEALECQKQTPVFQPSACFSLWDQYQVSKGSYDSLRNKMVVYSSKKDELESSIARLFTTAQPNSPSVDFSLEISELMRRNREMESALMSLSNVKRSKMNELLSLRRQLRQVQSILKECEENAVTVSICNEAATLLKDLPYTAHLDILKREIERRNKRLALMEGQFFDKQIYEQSRSELALLQSNYHAFLSQEEALCAQCSSVSLAQHSQTKATLHAQIASLTSILDNAQHEDQSINRKIEGNDKLIQQLKDKLERGIGEVQGEKKQMTLLRQLNSQLNQVRKDIADLQKDFLTARNKHNSILEQLESLYGKGLKINNCLAKKEYFDKLSLQQNYLDKKDDQKAKKIKDLVVKELISLEL